MTFKNNTNRFFKFNLQILKQVFSFHIHHSNSDNTTKQTKQTDAQVFYNFKCIQNITIIAFWLQINFKCIQVVNRSCEGNNVTIKPTHHESSLKLLPPPRI